LEYAPLFESRYKSIVTLIGDSGIMQVLELASGFSLRGLAMAQDANLRYIETDLPDLTQEKLPLIAKLRKDFNLNDFNNHRAVVANALELDELRTAIDTFDRRQKIAVVNEGLIQYFSVEERAHLARNVHSLLEEYGGVWITPDFTLKPDINRISEERKRVIRAVSGMTERGLYANAFANHEMLAGFFAENGFLSQWHTQKDLVPKLSSIKRLNIDESAPAMERLRQHIKIWSLTLASASA
jgi:O-methyltransferase involved in polyketide biosynthesis